MVRPRPRPCHDVVDQAYFEYIDDPDYPDAIEEHVRQGRRAIVLRTFSKIFGLAGLRVGYVVAHEEVVRALSKTRRAFDVTSAAQEAGSKPRRTRARAGAGASPGAERGGPRRAGAGAARPGFDPVPAVANFLYVEVGEDAEPLFEPCCGGLIVRRCAASALPARSA